MKQSLKEKIKQSVIKMDNQMLMEFIGIGIALQQFSIAMGRKKIAIATTQELYFFKQELKRRGTKVAKVTKEDGTTSWAFTPCPIPDPKRNSPITMKIPTPSQLMRGPIAPDLPKHGYLSAPTIHLPQQMD